MVVPHRSIALLGAFAVMSTLLSGCGESKVTQCNKLIGLANQATDEIKGLQQGGGDSAEQKKQQLEKIANSLDSYTQKAQGLSIQDEQLKAFQKQLIDLYQQTRDNSRALLTAVNTKDAKATNAALSKLIQGGGAEQTLIRSVNTYCAPANASPAASPAASTPAAAPQPAK
jgi:DNA repair exonuclease SbcCD ATPase subunit